MIMLCICHNIHGQCNVDEIEYIDVYASSHCTSTSLQNTLVILSPVRSYQYTGEYEWKMRENDSFPWVSIFSNWEYVEISRQLINDSVTYFDTTCEYLLVFTDDSTGCRDSAVETLVLDQSPIIMYSIEDNGGKKLYKAWNNAHPPSEGDEISWLGYSGSLISLNDSLISSFSPCAVQIIDCVGCKERVQISTCADKDIVCYPNPTDNMLYIQTIRQCNVLFCDITGRIIKKGTTDELHSMSIDTTPYANGMYIVMVCDEIATVLIQH